MIQLLYLGLDHDSIIILRLSSWFINYILGLVHDSLIIFRLSSWYIYYIEA